jgi:sRNA-binding regulator protein Hfq
MELDPKLNFQEILKQAQAENATVDVYLRSGQTLTGSVLGVGGHFIVIGHLQGKDFFDAQIRLDDVSAIALQTRGK